MACAPARPPRGRLGAPELISPLTGRPTSLSLGRAAELPILASDHGRQRANSATVEERRRRRGGLRSRTRCCHAPTGPPTSRSSSPWRRRRQDAAAHRSPPRSPIRHCRANERDRHYRPRGCDRARQAEAGGRRDSWWGQDRDEICRSAHHSRGRSFLVAEAGRIGLLPTSGSGRLQGNSRYRHRARDPDRCKALREERHRQLANLAAKELMDKSRAEAYARWTRAFLRQRVARWISEWLR